ncbi:MAG TPA: RNA polymerase sigma factor [Acidimicrobiales bacterium]|nr:RNA polymerase sigma factor [Acidimicrobiales bacterium]
MPPRAPADDDTLVAAAAGGDRDALEQLLARHHHRIYTVCRRLTGSDADAADASQDAMVAIVRGIGSFSGASRFSTWAYRVAVNASLDELRRRRRRPLLGEGEDLYVLADGAPPGAGSGATPSPAAAMAPAALPAPDGAADRLDIQAALRRLPPEFRAAVVLRDLCGLDYAEIAEVLDVPAGTVRSRIARGRAALAGLLGEGS